MATQHQEPIRIEISVRAQQGNYGSGGLNISETIELPQMGFIELAKVLAQFHELAQLIAAGKQISFTGTVR